VGVGPMRSRSLKRLRCLTATDDPEDPSADDDDVAEVGQIDNCVYFYGPVEEKRNLALLRALHAASRVALERCDWPEQARVYLYINSSGGDAYAGLGAMDQIRLNRVPIVAIAEGFVASAATFMLLGAHERKAMTHAKVLIHQLSTGFWGKYNDLLDEMQNSKELMATITEVYKDRTRLTTKHIERLLRKELHMSASDALQHGIVDEIW
jgi:ATP-dependent Clp endopeptidase proteolytic subunit ClpP